MAGSGIGGWSSSQTNSSSCWCRGLGSYCATLATAPLISPSVSPFNASINKSMVCEIGSVPACGGSLYPGGAAANCTGMALVVLKRHPPPTSCQIYPSLTLNSCYLRCCPSGLSVMGAAPFPLHALHTVYYPQK
jgi:hypothetical protein